MFAFRRGLDETADITVKVARFVVRQLQPHGDVFADDVVEVDVGVLAEQLQLHQEEPAQLFAEGKAFEHQHVRAQRRVDRGKSICLCQGHGSTRRVSNSRHWRP